MDKAGVQWEPLVNTLRQAACGLCWRLGKRVSLWLLGGALQGAGQGQGQGSSPGGRSGARISLQPEPAGVRRAARSHPPPAGPVPPHGPPPPAPPVHLLAMLPGSSAGAPVQGGRATLPRRPRRLAALAARPPRRRRLRVGPRPPSPWGSEVPQTRAERTETFRVPLMNPAGSHRRRPRAGQRSAAGHTTRAGVRAGGPQGQHGAGP